MLHRQLDALIFAQTAGGKPSDNWGKQIQVYIWRFSSVGCNQSSRERQYFSMESIWSNENTVNQRLLEQHT